METTEQLIPEFDVLTPTPDIPLGDRGEGKVLLNLESGIKDFVKTLSKEENHLPNTITGVFTHYLIKGIEEDFKRTFDHSPTSLVMRLKGLSGRS